jgi:hypothetical protein
MTIDEEGLRGLLARSTAIGVEYSKAIGDECVLWVTDTGEQFRTSYADAAKYSRVAV